ncbi:MAG: helix-turn-helix domain-containing protein [Candidatus Lariskella arthropodorum]
MSFTDLCHIINKLIKFASNKDFIMPSSVVKKNINVDHTTKTKLSESNLRFVLRKLMTDVKMTDKELSDAIGIARSTLHQLLNTESLSPKVETIRPIAKYFGVTIDQLIGDSPLSKTHEKDANDENLTDLREWHPQLYKQCIDQTCQILAEKKMIIPAVKALLLIREIYFYSLSKNKQLDVEFAQWFIEHTL